MTRRQSTKAPSAPAFRCAIYTRKSTDEGLDQEFNSLDAQRESAEAFIKSQTHEGWTCVPDRYDDGGFTGGNMDRPALRRLMADIEAGRVDCVVVYKVDRLSRSLLDFARMMETFEKHNVSFVSVTQQFNTASSMGRLVLNVLLSFAQFEREIISERTRDKIAATRRKGKWSGGAPLLGYDVVDTKLVVNATEAARVRAMFDLYLEHGALLPVVQDLERRGWRNKHWTTRKGIKRGGKPFTKTSLHKLLTNVVYAGKVRYKSEVHNGAHEALIDADTWQRVQSLLQHNGRTGGGEVRNKYGALLKGLLHCQPCGCAMSPAHSTKDGIKRYRYYVCTAAQKRGWHSCPSKSIPAGEIERFIVDQIRRIGRDPTVIAETVRQAQEQSVARQSELDQERRGLRRELEQWNQEIRSLLGHVASGGASALARLADLQDRIRVAERRALKVARELESIDRDAFEPDEIASALAAFDQVWETLAPREQARIVQLLVQRVDYDGANGRVAITFHPNGIRTLAQDPAALTSEEAA